MWEKIKGAGAVVLGWGFILLIVFLISLLIGLFVHGGAWLGAKVYPWLESISSITFVVTLLILLPLSFIQRTRGFASISLLVASFVFGLFLWVLGLILTYHLWGGLAVFLGLFLFGVGVVPVAMLATLFKGMWLQFGELVFLTALVFGVRAYSMYVAQKADRET
jgi:hypothetical protein